MKKAIVAVVIVIAVLIGATMLSIKLVWHSIGNDAFVSDRFEVISASGDLNNTETLFYDRETGVVYLWVSRALGGGLSPLYDANGEVTIYDQYGGRDHE